MSIFFSISVTVRSTIIVLMWLGLCGTAAVVVVCESVAILVITFPLFLYLRCYIYLFVFFYFNTSQIFKILNINIHKLLITSFKYYIYTLNFRLPILNTLSWMEHLTLNIYNNPIYYHIIIFISIYYSVNINLVNFFTFSMWAYLHLHLIFFDVSFLSGFIYKIVFRSSF